MTSDRKKCALMKVAVVVGLLSLSLAVTPVAAQQKEMTVEELEKFIARKKAALEQVVENRELTEEKARKIQEALDKQDEQQKALEAEFETLCREQEQVKPDTFEQCMAEQNG
jgi:plasmid maintenance system antidote protein VapI